jgi:hypothetical protein
MVDGRLSTVIDFGASAVGDPAVTRCPRGSFPPAEVRGVFRAASSAHIDMPGIPSLRGCRATSESLSGYL